MIRRLCLHSLLVPLCLSPGCRWSSQGEIRGAARATEKVEEALEPFFSAKSGGIVDLAVGELADGHAVLLNRFDNTIVDAGFWVHDGVVYAVNDVAESIGVSLSPAPESIRMNYVRVAVHQIPGKHATPVPPLEHGASESLR